MITFEDLSGANLGVDRAMVGTKDEKFGVDDEWFGGGMIGAEDLKFGWSDDWC
jgi:hypothetical protein